MAKAGTVTVHDAVHKIQLRLLDGIQDENLLHAAGSLMSRNDYQDVVTERTIANMCGYPLCSNSLPSERLDNGRYRISLKVKVYDLQETYLYCSTSCLASSRSFARSFPNERCASLNPARIKQVLGLFEGIKMNSEEGLGKYGDLGFSGLKIREKTDIKSGEVSFEEWIGASGAIEGYTPQKENIPKPQHSKRKKEGSSSTPKHGQLKKENLITFNDMEFTSEIITQDEYSISKSPGPENTHSSKPSKDSKVKLHHKGVKGHSATPEKPGTSVGSPSKSKSQVVPNPNGEIVNIDDLRVSELSLTSNQDEHDVEMSESNGTVLKSSLKSSDSKKLSRSITWADEKRDANGSKNLCEYRESKEKKIASGRSETIPVTDDYNSNRLASAEACAEALIQAAEAVASGEFDVSDAVSEAGLIVLPPLQEMDDNVLQENDDDDVLNLDQAPVKWPTKPGSPDFDFFESEDSWYDSPPEGFSLTLSPFSTMFMSLFQWMSSSSLAYIYGRDESCHEEYLSVNGREYPRKVVLADGRSSEIKQTLAGCLARALPGLVTDLRLPTPISTLEQGMARLLDTMSFIDSLHSFRMKQWQVLVHLFLDALSVCRIPTLAPFMTGRRVLLPKVLEGAQISAEDYEILKDLMIPLGRVPQFSTQSGG